MIESAQSIRAESMDIDAQTKIIGARVQRREDPRLLTGAGRYTADIKLPNMAHVAFRRSDHAHAKIVSIDATAALDVPGVIGVYTAADFRDRITPLRAKSKTALAVSTANGALADGKVRYVGEPIVAVVAESRYVAEDAVSLIEIIFEPLPAAVDPEAAALSDAPLLHEEEGTNVLIERTLGKGDVDAGFANAAVVVGGKFRMTRKSASPMECRGCVAEWDGGRSALQFHSSTQNPGIVHDSITQVFGLPGHRVRVIAPDVGGGFGSKGILYPDEMTVCALAMMLGRPVKWISDRLEDLVSTTQAFDERVEAQLALDAEGRILGLSADVISDAGAYSIFPWTAAMEPVQVIAFLPGPYRVPAYKGKCRAVATPKTPLGAYRGVGRPTSTFVMERLLDLGASKLGLSPLEIRRRNLIQPDEFPYKTASGIVWDRSGFTESLEAVIKRSEYDNLRSAQELARKEGKLVGIGLACYAELTGLGSRIPVAPGIALNTGDVIANVRIDSNGSVVASFGVASQGQGHETVLAQVVAQELGCRVEDVDILIGDSSLVAHSTGTFASRVAVLAGGAATLASRAVRDNVLHVAAHLLEVAAADLELAGGRVAVRGTDKALTLRELAHIYYKEMGPVPREMREEYSFEVTKTFDPFFGTTSSGCHLVMVEVDPVTWGVKIMKYFLAEDGGRIINPMIAEGQAHGGVAQGIGAALFEEMLHDEDGQILTASLVDYALPTAVEVPAMEVLHIQSKHPENLTGFRGIGEGATIGSPAAIANAVADALGEFGADIRELPLTPERIFRLVEAARRSSEIDM